MQIIANKPSQRVAAGLPQRVPEPSTSVEITVPETIRTSQPIHQRHTRSNTPMPSIIKEVVDVEGVRFNLPPQQVDINSDEWRRKYLKQTCEMEINRFLKISSRRQSNPQIILDDLKQTSARYASNKTIQRLFDKIQKDNFMSVRQSKSVKVPIRCQTEEELKQRQLKKKPTPNKKNSPKFN